MKPLLSILLSVLLFSACSQQDQNGDLPRIAIAGLAIESSTFSPAQTQEEAFHARVGDEVFTFYPFLSPDSLNRTRAEWFPTLRGHALPGGIVTREAYESLVAKPFKCFRKTVHMTGSFLTFTEP